MLVMKKQVNLNDAFHAGRVEAKYACCLDVKIVWDAFHAGRVEAKRPVSGYASSSTDAFHAGRVEINQRWVI